MPGAVGGGGGKALRHCQNVACDWNDRMRVTACKVIRLGAGLDMSGLRPVLGDWFRVTLSARVSWIWID